MRRIQLKRAASMVFLGVSIAACGLVQADTFRCGRKVVRAGDSQESVVERCGQPQRRESGYESLWLANGHQRVRVERWLYKTGERRLERVVLLYRGEVVGVRTGRR